jgi:hypothetical protein
MLNVLELPRQETPLKLKIGVTEMLEVSLPSVLFEAVKLRLPVPEPFSPFDGFELVQS